MAQDKQQGGGLGMAKIFISYRRADSETIVGRIYDRLIGRFGADAIFKDVDSIPLGLDFKQYVSGVIQQCAVQLVIIGPRWLDITDARSGRRRLDDPADNVRVEIESAIAANILIIPLLVERAIMPDIERLPESLHPLATRNGRPVRNDPDFNHDIERVLAALVQYLHGTPGTGTGTGMGTSGAGTGTGAAADPQTVLVRQVLPEIERAYTAGDWMGVSDRAAYLARHAPNALPVSVYRMWGAALYEEGDLAGARRAFDGALGLDAAGKPTRLFTAADLPALLSAAELRTRAGEPAAAEPLLADALALPGTDAATQLSVLREYMNLLIALGRWDDMLRRVTQAMRLAPDDINLLRARLDALMHLDRTAEAAQQARQLAAHPDARVGDWIALARLTKSTTSNANEVRAVLDDAERRFPGDPHLRQVRGELLPPPVPRERFPERLERLGFAAALGRDPQSGREVSFIRPPLCPVLAGPFLMGSDPRQDSQAYDTEQPQITVELPAYQIGRFSVTVAEYACFVAAGHAEPQKGYLGTDWQTQLKRLDHPVTCVNWKDARDYAAWLAGLTGQPWKLPSEAEWEKAARWDARGNGGRGLARIYPWGDRFDSSRCNTSESGIKTTTAVGTYGPENPSHDGSSPYGAQDMAGNVWEWTRTIWDAQAYSKKTLREDANSTGNRVLRGGSWDNDARIARAAFRGLGGYPVYFDDAGGFRVVLLAAAGY